MPDRSSRVRPWLAKVMGWSSGLFSYTGALVKAATTSSEAVLPSVRAEGRVPSQSARETYWVIWPLVTSSKRLTAAATSVERGLLSS